MAKKKPSPRKSGKDGESQKSDQNGKPKKPEFERQVPIEHKFGTDVLPIFSNHFVIRHEAGMFHLYFFHTRGPMILTDDEQERKKLLEQVESVPSNCVSHVVVTPDDLRKIMGAMAINFSKSQSKQRPDVESS